MKRILSVTAVLLAAAGCDMRTAPPSPVATAPAFRFTAEWAGEMSVYDILPRAEKAIARVAVARRKAPAAGVVSLGDVTIFRECGSNPHYCVDGLRTVDEKTAASGPAQTFLSAELTADDRERLTGEGSWLERGVRPLHVGPDYVSYAIAEAWLTAGAAASSGEISCRTHPRTESAASLDAIWGPERSAAAVKVASAFLAEQRDLGDRARGLSAPDPKNILLESDDAVVFCLSNEIGASSGFGERLRVRAAP